MKDPIKIPVKEITEEAAYFNRRRFIQAGVLAASAVATRLVYRRLNPVGVGKVDTPSIQGLTTPSAAEDKVGLRADEAATSFQDITHYNNFYEFSTDKEGWRLPLPDLKPKVGKSRSKDWCANPGSSTSKTY